MTAIGATLPFGRVWATAEIHPTTDFGYVSRSSVFYFSRYGQAGSARSRSESIWALAWFSAQAVSWLESR
jgi:hypothetical protein